MMQPQLPMSLKHRRLIAEELSVRCKVCEEQSSGSEGRDSTTANWTQRLEVISLVQIELIVAAEVEIDPRIISSNPDSVKRFRGNLR